MAWLVPRSVDDEDVAGENRPAAQVVKHGNDGRPVRLRPTSMREEDRVHLTGARQVGLR
jgi:hypothetical protein